LALGLHALEHQLRYALGQIEFFNAEEFDIDSVIVSARVGLNALKNFTLDIHELELLRIGRHEMRKRMPAHDAAERVAHQAFKTVLRLSVRAAESREKQ